MALEAAVFPEDPLGGAMKELFGFEDGGGWNFIYDGFRDPEEELDGAVNYGEEWDVGFPWQSPVAVTEHAGVEEKPADGASEAAGRRKKRRRTTKGCKNEEEVESQRMTHIAVERNRRLLMNEHLTVLRSIMPHSYVQRGDQASIVGGAINFVKELEQLLQSLEAQRRLRLTTRPSSSFTPFSDSFTIPQYSTSTQCTSTAPTTTTTSSSNGISDETIAKNHSAAAEIEVTMVESHAKLKVLSMQRPKQLLRMVVDLQNLRLTTLHLNVTTVEQMVLYSFSLKVEDDCHLTTVDDIATAVYHIVGKIQEDAGVI